MIGNIFRKDLRLLWPMATIVASAHVLTGALLSFPGDFERGAFSRYEWLSNEVLPAICLLGLVILTLAVVQQDRFPGSTQDWLTRPIPRRQLVAAKLLFVFLIGLGPVLLSDVISGIAEHLPWRDVMVASLTRALLLFGVVCLPAFLVGIVTRSLTDALLFTLGLVIVVAIELIVLAQTDASVPLVGSGFGWTLLLVLLLVNFVTFAVLLPLQLRWRATNRVRWLAAACLVALPAVTLLPWSGGFWLHVALLGAGRQQAVAVKVDQARKPTFSKDTRGSVAHMGLSLPVSVSTSAPDQLWELDHGYVQLIDPASGKSLDTVAVYLTGDPNSEGGRRERVYATVPTDLFRMAQGRHATLSATMYITTFRQVSRQPVVGIAGGSIDEYSRCRSAYGLAARCVSTRPVASCIQIESPKAIAPQPWPGNQCQRTSYVNWPMGLWRDPYYTFPLPPADAILFGRHQAPTQPATSELKDARVLRNFAPDAHVVQHIEFALDDLTEGRSARGPKSLDGVGAAARFAAPAGMVADSHGNLFIVDRIDSVVRKVSASGEVTTVAGQAGIEGRSDGEGRDALFDHPGAIAIDSQDNLYVADTGNALVRKISPSGTVTTIAGGTRPQGTADEGPRLLRPTGVAVTRDGGLYVIDSYHDLGVAVLKILPGNALQPVAGPNPPPATDARLQVFEY